MKKCALLSERSTPYSSDESWRLPKMARATKLGVPAPEHPLARKNWLVLDVFARPAFVSKSAMKALNENGVAVVSRAGDDGGRRFAAGHRDDAGRFFTCSAALMSTH